MKYYNIFVPVQNKQGPSHLLLLVVQLLLLVDKVLLQAGQHLHGDVHLPGQFRGLVLQVLLLLAQSLALLLGPLQFRALPLQLSLQATHAGRYFLLHLRDRGRT